MNAATIESSFVTNATPRVWLLPDGGPQALPASWLDAWEAAHGYARLVQHDWHRPLRGDWSARLQETLIDAPGPVVLVASGLGCILTAWWAAHSPAAAKVRGALLVAPTDVEQPALREQLPGWSPIARQPLPFPSMVVAGPPLSGACSPQRAQALAQAWGAVFIAGDETADAPIPHALLQTLLKDEKPW